MKLFIERSNETRELSFQGTVRDLLSFLQFNPVSVLVSRDHELLTEEDVLSDTDNIHILSVVSGG